MSLSSSLTEFSFSNRRKNFCLILIIILASSPLTYLIMHMGHDASFHLNRIAALSDSLFSHFQFPLRISTYYFDGYGYASSIYYPDLFLYLPAILNGLGCLILPEQSDKIILISYQCYVLFVHILTTLIAFYSFKKISKSNLIAIVVTAVYVLNPYRWVSIYTRSAIGEYTAMAFLPLVAASFYSIYVSEGTILHNALLLALAMTGIMESHLITTEFTVILLLVLSLVLFKKTFTKPVISALILAIGFFLGLNAFFIVPLADYMLTFKAQINNTLETSNTVQFHGIYPSQYISFFSSLEGVSNPDLYSQHLTDRFQMTPGIILMASLFSGIVLWFKKKTDKKETILLSVTLVLMIMSTIYFPWSLLIQYTQIGKILSAIQFPWRLLGFIVVLLSMLLLFQLRKMEQQHSLYKKIIISIPLICGLMVCWYNSDMCNHMDFTVSEYLSPSYVAAGEYLPAGTDTTLCDGTCSENVENFVQNGTTVSFSVRQSTATFAEIPVFNYKYYIAYDSSENPMNISNGHNNVIRIELPASYSGNITIEFQPPIIWKIAEIFSILSLVGILLLSRKTKKIAK